MKKFLILLILFIGCNKEPLSKYDGLWILEKIEVSGKNQIKYFHVNSIKFNSKTKNGTVPGSIYAERDLNINWDVIFHSNAQDSIRIYSKNWLFNGNFKVTFFNKQSRQYFSMKSDSIYIEGYNAFR